jgi:hypothetical protein
MNENPKLIDALVAATRCAETLAQVIRSMSGVRETEVDLDDDYQFDYDDPAAHKRMLDEYERLGRERRAAKAAPVAIPAPDLEVVSAPAPPALVPPAEEPEDEEDTSGTDEAGEETDIGGGESPVRPGTIFEQIVKVLRAHWPHWMTPPGIRTVINEGKKPKYLIGENEVSHLLARQRIEQTFLVSGLQCRPHGARFEYRIVK